MLPERERNGIGESFPHYCLKDHEVGPHPDLSVTVRMTPGLKICGSGGQGNENLDTRAFYVDNCLQSLIFVNEGRTHINAIGELLSAGGFDIRQWTSNIQSILEDLSVEGRAASTERWLSQCSQDPEDLALHLCWNLEQPPWIQKSAHGVLLAKTFKCLLCDGITIWHTRISHSIVDMD